MFVTLLRKQFLELYKFIFQNKKTGERRSKKSIISGALGFGLLMLLIAMAFVGAGVGIISPLHTAGLDWMYFLIMIILSILLGAFGSVFNTYAALFKAGDNDLLLSLPIKPDYIIASRLVGTYVMGFMYEAVVIIPAVIVYWVKVGCNVPTAIMQVILVFAIGLLVLSLSVVLGYVVAVLSTRIKSKAFISVVCSLLVIGVYYFSYFKAQELIKTIVKNSQEYSDKIKSSAIGLYYLGNAGVGDVKAFLLTVLTFVLLFVVVYAVLRMSFVKLSTRSLAGGKRKAGAKSYKALPLEKALVFKELKRFASSPAYMMNTGIGLLILPAMAIGALIKSQTLIDVINEMAQDMPSITSLGGVFVCVAVGFVCSLCCLTAPSISLEGKSFWMLKSLPIDSYSVLTAKLKAHIAVNIIPVLFSTVLLCIAFKADAVSLILAVIFSAEFILFMGIFGLFMNLKRYNLTWTNEIVPVKQGLSVLFSMLMGWAVSMVMGIALFGFSIIADVRILSAVFVTVFALADCLLLRNLKTKGTRLFEEIS